MLKYNKKMNGEQVILSFQAEINTANAKEFQELMDSIDSNDIVLDFKDLDYITSAGLRTLLVVANKIIQNKGKMAIVNMNEIIKDIFDITGFDDIVNIGQ